MTPGNTGLARFLLPWRCALCAGVARDGRGLCDACAEYLPRADQACPRCGIRVSGTAVTGTCMRCSFRPPGFHRMVAPLAYDYPVDRLLLGLKFGRRMHLARALGQAIAEGVRSQVERGVLEVPEALAPFHCIRAGWRSVVSIRRRKSPASSRAKSACRCCRTSAAGSGTRACRAA